MRDATMHREEQRAAPRFAAYYPVEYRLAGRSGDGSGRSVDLSETGLLFITLRRLDEGTHLTLRLSPRARHTPVLTRLANVVRCLQLDDDGGYAVACAYE